MATIHSNWMTTFEGLKFSSKDFYGMVEKRVKAHAVPAVKVSRINYNEGGLLSSKREYLRVEYRHLAFEICAAPFGNDFFVSWWFGNTSTLQNDIVRKLFKGLLGETATYYRLDTQAMFMENVRLSITRAIEEMTAAKGFKAINENTWRVAEPA